MKPTTGDSLAVPDLEKTDATPCSQGYEYYPKQPGAFPTQRQEDIYFTREQAAARATLQKPDSQRPNNDRDLGRFTQFSKGLRHNSLDEQPDGKLAGEVDAVAYQQFLDALSTPRSGIFQAIENLAKPQGGNPPALGGPFNNFPNYLNFTNPLAGEAHDLEGFDTHATGIPPAPGYTSDETAAEMAELYLMALLRDVAFTTFADTEAVHDAANYLSRLPGYRGPRDDDGAVTPQVLFRASLPMQEPTGNRGFQGVFDGPFISQFLLRGTIEVNGDGTVITNAEQGIVAVGSLRLSQQQRTVVPDQDYLTDPDIWFAVQSGRNDSGRDMFDEEKRFIRNMRDAANYVHFDKIYQEYFIAACILLSKVPRRGQLVRIASARPEEGGEEIGTLENEQAEDFNMLGGPFVPEVSNITPEILNAGNPYRYSKAQNGFATFGATHILTWLAEISTRAHKAVFYQKWWVHRRLRPEEFGGHVHLKLQQHQNYSLDPGKIGIPLLDRVKAKYGSYLLPLAFPEGCPTHPSYAAAHATLAGACVTILKALFNEDFVMTRNPENPDLPPPLVPTEAGRELRPVDSPPLTVGGELNKLASNIAFARSMAGVHWRSDNVQGLLLGERVAIEFLLEQSQPACYKDGYRPFYAEKHPQTADPPPTPSPFPGQSPFFRLTRFNGTMIDIENGMCFIVQDGQRVGPCSPLQIAELSKNTERDEDQTSTTDLTSVSEAAQTLVEAIFDKLKEEAGVSAGAEATRLFFPNGIELIDIGVKVGPKDAPLVDVHAVIAGEKGLKGKSLDSDAEDADMRR